MSASAGLIERNLILLLQKGHNKQPLVRNRRLLQIIVPKTVLHGIRGIGQTERSFLIGGRSVNLESIVYKNFGIPFAHQKGFGIQKQGKMYTIWSQKTDMVYRFSKNVYQMLCRRRLVYIIYEKSIPNALNKPNGIPHLIGRLNSFCQIRRRCQGRLKDTAMRLTALTGRA